jgi:hypothetical protein
MQCRLIDFQITRSNGVRCANERPRLLTPEAYQIVIRLVSDAFKWREPISMICTIEQIQLSFVINVSLKIRAQIGKWRSGLKTVKRILMERTRVMADENAIDAYCERISRLLPGIPRAFVVNADESGFQAPTTQMRGQQLLSFPRTLCSTRYIFGQIPASKGQRWLGRRLCSQSRAFSMSLNLFVAVHIRTELQRRLTIKCGASSPTRIDPSSSSPTNHV